MIRVGIVGLGFMGRMHYRCWKAIPGATVTAICESNPKVLAAAGEPSKGNVEGAADHIDLAGLSVHTELDELLASNVVDALSITLPTFLHADTTVKALEAGVHVLCEKPMALSVPECDRMTSAAERSGRVLQIGHCIRFWPEYVVTRQLIQGGQYGKPIAASLRRFTAMPAWSPDSWFADEKRSGGQPLDLHIHDTDYVHHLFGLPGAVSSVSDGPQTYISTQYHYPDGPAVVAESTWRMAPAFVFEMSFVVVLEGATILYSSGATPAFRVLTADGKPAAFELPAGDGYSREVEHFARALSGETVDPIITPHDARETIRLVLAEKQSARERRMVSL
jgi:predicted dehydrogenase